VQLAIRLCGRVPEAEDVAQEVFVKVHQQLDTFRMNASFSTWLYRITVNLCLDHQRKWTRRRQHHATAQEVDTQHPHDTYGHNRTPEREIWRSELQRHLHTALNAIRPKLRAVVVLKDIEGLSYDEIAQIVGCSPGTVSSRLNRGRKRLKDVLAGMGVDETYLGDS